MKTVAAIPFNANAEGGVPLHRIVQMVLALGYETDKVRVACNDGWCYVKVPDWVDPKPMFFQGSDETGSTWSLPLYEAGEFLVAGKVVADHGPRARAR